VQVGVFPLVKKPELMEVADRLEAGLRESFSVQSDASGSIGKRYRRLDEIGTPYCLTVDFDGLEDGTVTIRDRDTMAQERIPVDRAEQVLRERMSGWTPPG
jgi:glycyl-tRNA synthetase